MPTISVDRSITRTVNTVIDGLLQHNVEEMGKQNHKRFAVSLREKRQIIGGVVGEVWATVLFVQAFWIAKEHRSQGHGRELIAALEDKARRYGAIRAYVDTMSFNAPGFYVACGYREFGSIDGYPNGVTRHWLTKKL